MSKYPNLPYDVQAIVGFRETERKHWTPSNQSLIDRLRSRSFEPGCRQLPYVHVLDLAEDGYIKPHIDSVRVKPTPLSTYFYNRRCTLIIILVFFDVVLRRHSRHPKPFVRLRTDADPWSGEIEDCHLSGSPAFALYFEVRWNWI